MKKINKAMLFTMTLMMIVVCMCFGAGAVSDVIVDSGECGAEGDNVTWVLYDDGELVISGEGEMADSEGYLEYRYLISKATLSEGLVNICSKAFDGCYNLETINIPTTVTSIGTSAFSDCEKLKSIKLPADFTTCSGTNMLTKYGPLYKSSITEVVFESGMVKIPSYTCSKNSTLTTVYIPATVESIDKDAFNSCENLIDVYFEGSEEQWLAISVETGNNPLNNATINYNSVAGCVHDDSDKNGYCDICGEIFIVGRGKCGAEGDNVTWVLYSNGELIISGEGEIADCEGYLEYFDFISKVTISEGLVNICSEAFEGCENLETINIPSTITSIGASAFSGCTNLKSIILPADFTTCSGTNMITKYGPLYKSSITEVVFESGMVNIPSYTCSKNSALTTVHIPETVKSIGQYAFNDCENLADVYFEGSEEQWLAISVETGNNSLDNATIHCTGDGCVHDDSDKNGYCDKCGEVFVVLSGEWGIEGDNVVFDLYSNGELVISGEGAMKDFNTYSIHILEVVDIKRAVISDGVTSIGNYAFYSLYNLEEIVIPDSVASIGEGAFESCESLVSVNISDRVTNIGDNAFRGCENLTSIVVDPNNEYYANDSYGALFNKDISQFIVYPVGDTTTTYTFPDSTTTISGWGFVNSKNLTSLIIPEGVTNIDLYAFENCQNLVNITVDINNEYYSSDSEGVLFNKDESKLIRYPQGKTETTYTIPSSVKIVGERAFNDCKKLRDAIIPDNVTSIENEAFYGSGLADITIGKGVTHIGYRVFSYCYNLTSLTIPENVTNIGHISNVYNLTSIIVDSDNEYYSSDDCGVLFNKDKTELITYPEGRTETSYIIPDGVTNVGYDAFGYCDLESVTIPGSVVQIDYLAFDNCTELKDVYFNGSEEKWNNISIGSDNDPLLNANIHYSCEHNDADKDGNCDNCGEIFVVDSGVCGAEGDNVTWMLYSNGELVISGEGDMADYDRYTSPFKTLSFEKVIVNSGITSIGAYTFIDCYEFRNIILPKGIKSIGDHAFYYCRNLESITIPEGVTSIGNFAFGSCDSLVEFIIPNSVISIGRRALNWCRNLEAIRVDTDNEYFCSINGVLFNNNKTKLIQYPNGKTDTSYVIPNTVTSIENNAFFCCYNLTEIIIADGVTRIGEGAFEGCINLANIKIPDKVTQINDSTFYSCNRLTKVTIGNSVTRIGEFAFDVCENLTTVIIPISVKRIDYKAFDSSSELKDVYYYGTKDEWNSIGFVSGNDPLLNAKIHFLDEIAYLEENFEITFENGVLSIFGSGEIPSFEDVTDYPWNKYALSTTDLVISGVTSVGKNAFAGFSNLKSVIIDGRSDEGVCDVVVESESFADCVNLSLVVSYANINFYNDAITGNKTPVKYFNNAYAQNYGNIEFIPFSFEEEVIKETIEDETGAYEIVIETFKTVVNGEVSFNEDGFKRFISALYYFSDNNFVNIVFNRLTAEDFYIYEYTSLSPLQGKEITEVSAAKIFAIIETWPGDGEYMSLAMEDFCDFIASDEFNGHDYKFAVLGKAEEPEEDDDKEIPGDEENPKDEEYQEEEPNFIVKVFATIFEAIKKIFVLLKNLF